jgi:hypothetical protein
VVGGYAVMVYTEPRFTKDLDIWIENTPENAKRVFHALAEFGAPLSGMTVSDFAKKRGSDLSARHATLPDRCAYIHYRM